MCTTLLTFTSGVNDIKFCKLFKLMVQIFNNYVEQSPASL